MSALAAAAERAYRALCELEDELDAQRSGAVEDSEARALQLLVLRWSHDTERKIERRLDDIVAAGPELR